MSTKIPQATHTGEIKIGDKIIPCAVLEDGTRLLTQGGFLQALGRSSRPPGPSKGKAGFEELPAFLRGKSLKPYITNELSASSNFVVFRLKSGQKSNGYKATLLPKVCEVFLQAQDDNALAPNQARMAQSASILMRGLAHIGITALVDEATGYQADRARDALERILEQFIAKEYSKWLKTFPDDFYKEMFRLKGWAYSKLTPKRPPLIGRYTNDVIYARLAPEILEELRKKNPKDEKGRRHQRHHQWLTEATGHPRLREHLTAVIALMRISDNWKDFMKHLDKALPKYGTQMELLEASIDQPPSVP